MNYEHEYTSYRVPAPAVADPQLATEDCVGDLTTTHTLIRSLMDGIEGVQQCARQMKERPGSVSPEAVQSRLENLWALAETIDTRMKDHLILLYAVIDQANKEDIAKKEAA